MKEQSTQAAGAIDSLEKTAGKLQQVLSSFSPDNFNIIPFKDSWTAAQVVEHVHISASGVAMILRGNVTGTDRSPAENINGIKDVFMDFSSKFSAATALQPSVSPQDKETLLASLQQAFSAIAAVAETEDITDTCLDFSLPGFGALTRLEWIYFTIYHTQRHIHQLENIKACLS